MQSNHHAEAPSWSAAQVTDF